MTDLARTWVAGVLRPRSPMQVDDDKEVTSRSPSYNSIQVLNATLREVFTIRVYQVFFHPIAYRYPDSVQAIALHFVEVALLYPCLPMLLKFFVGSFLTQVTNAVELGVLPMTTNLCPCIFRPSMVPARTANLGWRPGSCDWAAMLYKQWLVQEVLWWCSPFFWETICPFFKRTKESRAREPEELRVGIREMVMLRGGDIEDSPQPWERTALHLLWSYIYWSGVTAPQGLSAERKVVAEWTQRLTSCSFQGMRWDRCKVGAQILEWMQPPPCKGVQEVIQSTFVL